MTSLVNNDNIQSLRVLCYTAAIFGVLVQLLHSSSCSVTLYSDYILRDINQCLKHMVSWFTTYNCQFHLCREVLNRQTLVAIFIFKHFPLGHYQLLYGRYVVDLNVTPVHGGVLAQ